jgi:hypothetical protein
VTWCTQLNAHVICTRWCSPGPVTSSSPPARISSCLPTAMPARRGHGADCSARPSRRWRISAACPLPRSTASPWAAAWRSPGLRYPHRRIAGEAGAARGAGRAAALRRRHAAPCALVGEGWAKRMILCNERIDAATAERIGLVEEVVRARRRLGDRRPGAGRAGGAAEPERRGALQAPDSQRPGQGHRRWPGGGARAVRRAVSPRRISARASTRSSKSASPSGRMPEPAAARAARRTLSTSAVAVSRRQLAARKRTGEVRV